MKPSLTHINKHIDILTGMRFESIQELNIHLSDNFGITATPSGEDIDTGDYSLLASVYGTYGYVDIYYTKGKDSILITEVSVSDE